MNNSNLNKSHGLRAEAPPAFAPQTMLVPSPDGVQVVIPFAPQVSLIMVFSLEQLKAAMEQCVQMRMGARRDLKPV